MHSLYVFCFVFWRLQAIYASGILLCFTCRLLPWLQSQLGDGGYLPSDEKAFQNAHGPRVIVQQDNNIPGRIFNEREHRITVILDESSDRASDTEPVNIVLITRAAACFVDTMFMPEDRDEDEKYGDAFGNLFVEWWDKYFCPHDPPNSTPLRYDVSPFVTDNVTYNIGAFKRHWAPRFTKAHHIRCIASVLNLVGAGFRDRPSLSILREFMSKMRSILKDKKNIRRRRRFRKSLQGH